MTDIDTVDERLRAVERAVADEDVEANVADPSGELAVRVDDLAETVAELDAGLQAVRGYVGEARSTDEEIESRADAALDAVGKLEERVDRLERVDAPAANESDRRDGRSAEERGGGEVPDAGGEPDDEGTVREDEPARDDCEGRSQRGRGRADRFQPDSSPSDSQRHHRAPVGPQQRAPVGSKHHAPGDSQRRPEPGQDRAPPARRRAAGTVPGAGRRREEAGRDTHGTEMSLGGARDSPNASHCPHCETSSTGSRDASPSGEYAEERDVEAATEAVDERGLVASLRAML